MQKVVKTSIIMELGKYRKEALRKRFAYTVPRIYNSLPENITI